MTTRTAHRIRPGTIPIRDVSLYVDVIGHGPPVLLMHGGPGADHWTLQPLATLADRFTVIFYDHRCNGRSRGGPIETMTFDNLTADAEALRRRLGYERWAVLGHSFGGHVALEYALRYPASLSHLILLDTGGDGTWARDNAADVLARRGFPPARVDLVRRWFHGDFPPRRMPLMLMRIGSAYYSRPAARMIARELIGGGWRSRMRPDALIFAGRHLMKDWSVMDRLGEITVPTLVMAGRDDFIFPPDHQRELAAGIPDARLLLVEHAGHNPHVEQPDQVVRAVRDFLAEPPGGAAPSGATPRPDPDG